MRAVNSRWKIFPGYGVGEYKEKSIKVVRLLRKGCNNRPFFHISVQESFKEPHEEAIEQIGSYDPFPNKYNEKVVAVNFKRLEYWIRANALVTAPVCALLGLAGYYPVSHLTFESAWQNRLKISKLIEELNITAAELKKEKETSASSSESTAAEVVEQKTQDSPPPTTETQT